MFFFFSSRRRHTRLQGDWSSDVCSSRAASAPHDGDGGGAAAHAEEDAEREPMSQLRRTITARLVEAQRTAAILTTFNEVDLGELMALRARHRERFKSRHGVDLGLMP